MKDLRHSVEVQRLHGDVRTVLLSHHSCSRDVMQFF